ncbi:MAG: histidinol-phosphate transaminase [Euryarchaeota archaeon]|nr:histidinol-phosphate transaminase [Euryarchaeota archaeon]
MRIKPRRAVRAMTQYVPGRPIEDVKRELGLTSVLKLASNENPLGPSPKAVEAVKTALAEAHRYPEPTSRALREAIASRWCVAPDAVFVGNGSDEIFRLLAETYLETGEAVVSPRPSFSVYASVARLVGARAVEVPLRGFEHDLEGMAEEASHARLVFLCRPNNPTGTTFDEASFKTFMGAVPPDTMIVLDEAYAEFDDSGFDARPFLSRHRNLIVSRTFAKAYGLAGLRLGYAVGDPEVLRPLFTTRDPFSVNRLAQAAGLASLEDEAHLRSTLETVRMGRTQIYDAARAFGLSYTPSQANFVLLEIGDAAKHVTDSLLKEGIIVRHTESFGLPHHIRVTVGTRDENERFIQGLRRAIGK